MLLKGIYTFHSLSNCVRLQNLAIEPRNLRVISVGSFFNTKKSRTLNYPCFDCGTPAELPLNPRCIPAPHTPCLIQLAELSIRNLLCR